MQQFNLQEFDVAAFDRILERGLSVGLGKRGQQVCIEAAICQTLGMPHGDNPKCVARSVRRYKITLNDADWSSPQARAKGLRDLGLAQLGSLDVVDDVKFSRRLAEKTIRILLPKMLREFFPHNERCLKAALRCEHEGSTDAAAYARDAAYAANAAAAAYHVATNTAYDAASAVDAAYYAADAANAVDAASAVDAAYYAADAANAAYHAAMAEDTYLILSANLALETLRELNSPGIALLK